MAAELLVLILLLSLSFSARACGAYIPVTPEAQFFYRYPNTLDYYERQENLLEWQKLTSEDIPLADIEKCVYGDNFLTDEYLLKNRMRAYVYNNNDEEIEIFLWTARYVSEKRSRQRSPWYYPSSRQANDEQDDFRNEINKCKEYDGHRLRDRYALQMVRILFSTRRYGDCIEYYDSAFAVYPNSNLMKRMAQRYVAGCRIRLGDSRDAADSLYALSGDIWSIGPERGVEYMLRYNPDAPQTMEYIRGFMSDSASLARTVPLAESALANHAVSKKGDWAYLLAYYYHQYAHDDKKAANYIKRAKAGQFSTEELSRLADMYSIKINAANVGDSELLAFLRRAESYCNVLDIDCPLWERRIRDIIYTDFVPRLWKKRDCATAILLAAYADNLPLAKHLFSCASEDPRTHQVISVPLDSLRNSENETNSYDYSSLSFQLMGRLSSSELASVYGRMQRNTPLYNHLRTKCRTDRDYYYELIGTLAMREENYSRAVHYLSQVSEKYMRTTNICKHGYLCRDPFRIYYDRWRGLFNRYVSEDEYHDHSSVNHRSEPAPSAKLDFARKMLYYKQQIASAPTADERGWAAMMYAVGRKNSFEECWALTQYWRGEWVGLFDPDVSDEDDDRAFAPGSYRYDYTYADSRVTLRLYNEQLRAAVDMMETDECKARAEYFLGNLAAVVSLYPDTQAALTVRTSCDYWENWI